MIKLIKSTFYKEKETKTKLIKFISLAKQLSLGSECKKFEVNFAKYQERKHCVLFNSGSSANLALIQSLLNLGRLQQKDMVGFSALTWATNVMPLIQLNLKPIPIDVELETLNVSSRNLSEIIEKYPLKALFITNLLGFCDDLEKIKNLCKSKKIILLEDNCEALGTVYKGRKLGNFGLASTFSFFVGHHMSTIEGGAVCTDDKELAQMLKMVRAHGWDRSLDPVEKNRLQKKKGVGNFYSNYTFYDLGYNIRPTEINGFLGNNQIRYLGKIIKKRNENFLNLAKNIYKNPDLIPIKHEHIDFVSNFAVPVICRSKPAHLELIKRCKDILEIRPIVGGNVILQPFFKKYYPAYSQLFKCPNAGLIHRQGLYFGNNPELTRTEIEKIVKIFK